MKTAISLSDDTFQAASSRAAQLGVSRSEFFAMAARRYLEELDNTSLTARINEALEDARADDSSTAAVTAGRRRLAGPSDW